MTIAEVTKKMIDFSDGNLHNINHFLKVYAFAKTIGEGEHLDARTQEILEITALVHDIACPLCRKKYGTVAGPYQEKEGALMVPEFFKDSGYPQKLIDRVAYLVGHHHTLDMIDGDDYQILIEADYIVNAEEDGYSKEDITAMVNSHFKTATGIAIIKSLHGLA